MEKALKNLYKKLGYRYQSHPWHGINLGDNAPKEVMSFIEMTPSDSVKYEIDKEKNENFVCNFSCNHVWWSRIRYNCNE